MSETKLCAELLGSHDRGYFSPIFLSLATWARVFQAPKLFCYDLLLQRSTEDWTKLCVERNCKPRFPLRLRIARTGRVGACICMSILSVDSDNRKSIYWNQNPISQLHHSKCQECKLQRWIKCDFFVSWRNFYLIASRFREMPFNKFARCDGCWETL